MTCSKLKEPTDFERILARALCYALGESNRGVILKEDGLTIMISMALDGKLRVEDVTDKMEDLEEGTIIEMHETMEDAVTSAALRGGKIRGA